MLLRSEESESESESSLSRTDLQVETRWECLRHAAFLMILSRDGPITRPHRDGPPRVCEADIFVGSVRMKKMKKAELDMHLWI